MIKISRLSPVTKIIFLVVIILAVYFGYDFFKPKPQNVEYKDFVQQMQNSQIKEAEISVDYIDFVLVKDEKGQKYRTDNPHTFDISERLLLSGTSVKYLDSATETFSFIFDLIFYLIFALIFIFVFKKFISPNTFKIVRKTGVKFSDIIGMSEIKNTLSQVADVMKHPAEYRKKGIRLPKGILLEGAPGNGKTLFARALASEADVNFIPAKATDFESMFMAIGPMKVKLLFKKARRNAPCIVFIDEFDGIGTKRNYSGSAIETENTRIVTALLNELDGFTVNDGVLVVAATNSRAALDEALIRPGRFDSKFTVPYPDKEARIELIKKYSANKSIAQTIDLETLAKKFEGFSCAHIESLFNRAALLCTQRNALEIEMQDIVNAAKEL